MKRDLSIAVLIALIWAAAMVALHWGNLKLDTTAIYYAAKSWSAGMPELVYAPGPVPFLVEPPQQWVDWAAAEGWEETVYFTPFLYPPLWAVLFAPIAGAVSSGVFFDGTLVAFILASFWMVWLSWRFVRPNMVNPVAWSGLSFLFLIGTAPAYMIYGLGQPQVIVAAVTLAAFVALANGRDVLSGGLLALVAAAKLSPALLVIIFIMEKRWTALAAFAGFGAALAGLSVALAGWPLHAELLAKLSAIEGHILISRINAGAELVLYQLGETLAGRAEWVIGRPSQVAEPGWVTWITRAIMIVGFAAVWWTSRDVSQRLRIWLRLLGVLLVALIANPLGWVHYLILPFMMLPGLLAVAERRLAVRTIGVTFVLFSMPVYLALNMFGAGDWVQVGINFFACVALILVVIRVAQAEANP